MATTLAASSPVAMASATPCVAIMIAMPWPICKTVLPWCGTVSVELPGITPAFTFSAGPAPARHSPSDGRWQDNKFTHHYQDGHLTPIGLFELLDEQHDCIIVLDDVAEILENPELPCRFSWPHSGVNLGRPNAGSSSIGRQGPRYIRAVHGRIDPDFQSGTALRSLAGSPKEPDQLLQYNPTEDEIAALMRDIASHGWPAGSPKITPAEGMEITEFLIRRVAATCIPTRLAVAGR